MRGCFPRSKKHSVPFQKPVTHSLPQGDHSGHLDQNGSNKINGFWQKKIRKKFWRLRCRVTFTFLYIDQKKYKHDKKMTRNLVSEEKQGQSEKFFTVKEIFQKKNEEFLPGQKCKNAKRQILAFTFLQLHFTFAKMKNTQKHTGGRGSRAPVPPTSCTANSRTPAQGPASSASSTPMTAYPSPPPAQG